jgi:hypothetical protein
MPDRTARTISCARPGGVDEGAPGEPGDGPQVHLARIRAEGTFDGVAQGQLSLIPGSLVRVRPAGRAERLPAACLARPAGGGSDQASVPPAGFLAAARSAFHESPDHRRPR